MAQPLPLGDYFFRRIPIFLKLSIFHSNIVYNNCITVPNISAEKNSCFIVLYILPTQSFWFIPFYFPNTSRFAEVSIFLSTFPKTLQTECSCSASRIGTLCFTIFFLRTLPTPQRLSRFCFSGCCPSCLKSRQTAASQNESKRWGSIPFHFILTSPSAFWRLNHCAPPCFLYFPYFIYYLYYHRIPYYKVIEVIKVIK